MSESFEFARAMQMVSDFRRDIRSTPADKVDLLEQEKRVQQVIHALGRELMREVFEQADVKQPEIQLGGVRYGNRRDIETTYTTLIGDVRASRSVFSKAGGGPVVVPLELRLGVVEGRYTPAVARVMARARASMPAAEAHGLLTEAGVATVSVSTLNRVPKLMAARYEQMREQINEQLRQAEQVPDAAATVQVGLDGVMVPQDGENAKPRGRKTAHPKAPRHETRYGPVGVQGPANDDGASGRSWHEASVGTLAFFDDQGNHLRTIYLARMPEPKMGTLTTDLERELQQALEQRPDLDICFASDGDHHQWSVLEGMAERASKTALAQMWFLLDFYHAAEYLAEAAALAHGADSADAHATRAEWCEKLKHAQDGPAHVLKAMRFQRDKLAGAPRKRMQQIIDYLATNNSAGRLGYALARANKKPIGTGITEAAAKTVVNVPMKRAGARFDQHGGQTILTFRSALLSGRFDLLCTYLENTYMANVA